MHQLWCYGAQSYFRLLDAIGFVLDIIMQYNLFTCYIQY